MVGGIFTTPGPTLPVKHLHLNFGAPGDRRDAEDNLWLAWPRPRTSSSLKPLEFAFDIEAEGSRPTTYFDPKSMTSIGGTARPWIYASGYEGVTHIGIPVLGADDSPSVYTVRLHFAELAKTDRRFDIAVQDVVVSGEFEIGEPQSANVREFTGIEVFD